MYTYYTVIKSNLSNYNQLFIILGVTIGLVIIDLVFGDTGGKISTKLIHYSIQILFIFLILTIVQKRSLEFIGLSPKTIIPQIKKGLLVFLFNLFLIGFFYLLGGTGIFNFNFGNSLYEVLWLLIYSLFFTTLSEEIIFRVFYLENFREIFKSDTIAIISSSILFGLVHYQSGFMNIVASSLIGFIYSYIKLNLKDVNLISLVLIHSLHNTMLALLAYLYVYVF